MNETFLPAFLRVVGEHPEKTALEGSGQSFTYAELLGAVRSAAGALAARGVRAGDHVALQLPRSPEFVVGLLAVWWLGAAWVPVDGDWPAARRDLVLRELAPRVVLGAIETGDPVAAHPALTSDLAYVIYTSGSTGVPKGVRVSHAGLCAVLRAQIAAFGLGPSSRVLQVLGHGFDASLSDIGTALLAGATLIVDPGPLGARRVLEALVSTRATHVDLPPALLARIDPAQAPATLACVVVGGEPSAPEVLLAWAARGRVVLVYGPTETTICSSLLEVDASCTTLGASIGRPIAGFEYQVDDGELVIRGPGVALGYVDRPALERARFVNGSYRTGDVVVARPDGTWDFVGRVDRQVKVRGVLVAPEEIEAALTAHPRVQRAAVVLREGRLVAFVVGRATRPELEEHVTHRLPRALRPQHVELVAELPQHASGKIDWAGVAQLGVSMHDAPFVEPQPGPEARLAAVWSEALGVPVGRDSTFLALGGDSLAALEIVAAAEAQGLPVTSEALYRGASLAAIAAAAPAEPCAVSALRADVAALLATLGVPTPRRVTSGRVLLTGATGFFGSRVLLELLETTDERIVCVVRENALPRLRAALARHGATLDEARVELLVGDLARPRFGLDDATWARLCETVAVIHHVAAAVNLVLPYARLRDANLVATRNVLVLATKGRVKHLHYASTLSVAACAAPAPAIFHEHDPLQADLVYGGYAASKWAAEELVRRAQLPSVCTVRLGLLTGDSRTGRGSSTCQLVSFLRGLVALGAVVDLAPEQAAALRVDVTPVDFAARAFVGLVTSGHDTVHLASDVPATWTALVAALDAAGARLPRVSLAELRARVGRARLDQTLATTALAACRRVLDTGQRHVTSDLFLASDVRFDTTRARAAGYRCPPADATLLGLYAREALA